MGLVASNRQLAYFRRAALIRAPALFLSPSGDEHRFPQTVTAEELVPERANHVGCQENGGRCKKELMDPGRSPDEESAQPRRRNPVGDGGGGEG